MERYPEFQDEQVVIPELEQAVNLKDVGEDLGLESKDELLFPGGPTYDELEKWKSQFNGEIYYTEFDEENKFIWRPIRRKEFKEVSKVQADQFYKEERVAERCILFPKNYGFMDMTHGKAGIPSLLYELILEKSGFVATTGAMKLS